MHLLTSHSQIAARLVMQNHYYSLVVITVIPYLVYQYEDDTEILVVWADRMEMFSEVQLAK